MKLFKKMQIKIQNQSVSKNSDTKGSSRSLAEYLNHEDEERMAEGKDPIPFLTPDGQEVSTEEVIEAIDNNAKGLCKKDDKFFHMVVAPSAEEVEAMGEDDETRYKNAISLMRSILTAYAENFHREGVEDASDLVAYWKPHFTRGDDDEYQLHIHVIVSRKAKEGMDGKSRKISPLTNHHDTEKGAVKGGFDRKLFFQKCEEIFDKLFNYERSVAESFDYRNAMAHGTTAERAEQTERLAKENATDMKSAIQTGIERRRKSVQTKNDVEEIAALLEGEQISFPSPRKNAIPQALEQAEIKNEIMEAFSNAEKNVDTYLALAQKGIVCHKVTSSDGVESLDFYVNGVKNSSLVLFSEEEHKTLLGHFCRLTKTTPAYKTREYRAEQKAKQEQEAAQRKFGGPKLRR